MKKINVAAIQMVSTPLPEQNIETMQRLVDAAAASGADWVLLPEYWAIMGNDDTDKVSYAETLGDGPLQSAMSNLAQQHQITLFGGTIPLKSSHPNKVHNTLLAYNHDGQCFGRYDKMHLFGFNGLGKNYDEANTIEAGNEIPHLSIDKTALAIGICYDIRFPEFFRAQLPFEVLLLPAAFTYTTGKAHWQLLLRTRAIENQCYVIAAAQGGTHKNGRRTYGYSMIIDPWGEVLSVLPENEGMAMATLDPTRLNSVRSRLPALQHRCLP